MFTEAECSVLMVLQELNNGTPYCTSCLLIRLLIKRLHHQVTLNHILKSEPPSHMTTQPGRPVRLLSCHRPVSPVSDRPISVSASVTEAVSFQLNPQQFPLCRQQYFLTASFCVSSLIPPCRRPSTRTAKTP